jgi:hypothetical protein
VGAGVLHPISRAISMMPSTPFHVQILLTVLFSSRDH